MKISKHNPRALALLRQREVKKYLYNYFVREAHSKDEVDLDRYDKAYAYVWNKAWVQSLTRLRFACKFTGSHWSVLVWKGFMMNWSEFKRRAVKGALFGVGNSSW